MNNEKITFEELMLVYDHIGEEERHFNQLEMEYRKLASHWLLAALGAIGFVLTREADLPLNNWIIVIAICLAASVGIGVIWLLDLRVYHELLHAAFKEGVALERSFKEWLPPVRNNMLKSQIGGDIIKKVIWFYFFSITLLLFIANASLWMINDVAFALNGSFHLCTVVMVFVLYKLMNRHSDRSLSMSE